VILTCGLRLVTGLVVGGGKGAEHIRVSFGYDLILTIVETFELLHACVHYGCLT